MGGDDTRGVLRSVVELMRLPDEVDRGFLLQVLLAREALQSTGIGDGIAIPHPRSPIVLHISRPSVTLCFLEKAGGFRRPRRPPGARSLHPGLADGAGPPATPFARRVRLRDEAFRGLITRVAARDEILAAAARVDGDVAAHAAGAPAAGV